MLCGGVMPLLLNRTAPATRHPTITSDPQGLSVSMLVLGGTGLKPLPPIEASLRVPSPVFFVCGGGRGPRPLRPRAPGPATSQHQPGFAPHRFDTPFPTAWTPPVASIPGPPMAAAGPARLAKLCLHIHVGASAAVHALPSPRPRPPGCRPANLASQGSRGAGPRGAASRLCCSVELPFLIAPPT
ncbi:MAG: hypothetical protein J3K34DRAFT_413720 [Monoraphidium minutum]|nr:MAG: hypothetical protein J3K34DRAFT_413720 [Monoraphidium minutum]